MAIHTSRVRRGFLTGLLALAIALPLQTATAVTGPEIDAKVEAALDRLHTEVKGSDAITSKASGILVFPEVIKAGFVIAGEGGEGALRVGGKNVAYYTIFSGSVGLQAGGQKRDIIIAFMDAASLKKFEASDGWKAGVDGSVALINVGAGAAIDVTKIKEPIVGFVVGQKGLMAGVSVDGSKITRVTK
jgi:lipid-binding SYLF domain-containing protein